MRKVILLSLVVICAIAVIHGFFMPWAKASASTTKVAKGLAKSATGGILENTPFAGKFIRELDKATDKISDIGDIQIKTAVSGYDIPTLINKKTSQIAISIASVMFKDTKDLDKKSMLVYLLPILALVCVGLAVVGLKNNIALIVMAVMSGGIAVGGLYNMMTVDLSNLPIQISIEGGLWQTMYAYLTISVISIVWIVMDLKGSKK
ncbi:MAG: hypothetical protein Q7S30_00810 [Candidatus Omnitrophota bacterium]|nr:hypothetical protein [Candidatus Omnitrophota bacterium]